ncbi:MAG: polysaccharide deacetylase [Rhodospirillales bacterium]|nr:polysaccharide deacetylase [Rhodospirillales bacterium]
MTTASVAFTFDFDAESVWIGDDPANAERPSVLSQGTYGAKVAMPLLLELLEWRGVTATFFVPGVVAERYPERVEAIVAAGHELAVHGYTHTSPAKLSRDEEEAELVRAKGVLEGFGAEIRGYRSPSWDFSPHTLELLQAHGFAYSSNYMDDIRPYVHPGTSIVELPVQWILDDAAHWWFSPADWLKKISTTSEVRQIWEEELLGIERLGGCCILTMHPQVIGRPSRLAFLDGFIGFVQERPGLRIATCSEIAAGAAGA